MKAARSQSFLMSAVFLLLPFISHAENSASDAEIANQIKQKISSVPSLAMELPSITVKSDDGVVTLTGKVSTQEDKRQISLQAGKVVSTNQIKNHLLVINPPSTQAR